MMLDSEEKKLDTALGWLDYSIREEWTPDSHALACVAHDEATAALIMVQSKMDDLITALREMEDTCQELARTRSQTTYDAMIASGQSGIMYRLDMARSAARSALFPVEPELKADFVRSNPSGMDDATYSEIEDALDSIKAPIRTNGLSGAFLKLSERVLALAPFLEANEAYSAADVMPCYECGSTERIGTACQPCNPELAE